MEIINPITGEKVLLCKEQSEVTYRGEKITYEKSYYRSLEDGFEFFDEQLEESNLKQIYDIYRKRHSIPLAEELKQMREQYGIPATVMSTILGLGENQYRLYEEGIVPALSVGKLLALAMDPRNLLNLLISVRSSFSDKQYFKYYMSIAKMMNIQQEYKIQELKFNDFEIVDSRLSSTISLKQPERKNRLWYYDKSLISCPLENENIFIISSPESIKENELAYAGF